MPPGGGGGGAPQQQGPDNSLAPLWISIGVLVVLGLVWHFYSEYINYGIFKIRLYEIKFLNLFIPAEWSPKLQIMKAYIEQTQIAGYSGVTWDQMVTLSTGVGGFLIYPVAAILGVLGILIYVGHASHRYKKTYSMDLLSREEVVNWPQITPVLKLNLLKEDLDKGPWAVGMQPMFFAKKYHLLLPEPPQNPMGITLKSKMKHSAAVNRDEARKLFAMQIGPFWSSIQNLPPYARALFAIFAARINGDREGAVALLKTISLSAGSDKLDYTGTDELLKKYKDSKVVKSVTQQHAFVLTVMASMLQAAREDGVLATADFLWLKPKDRKLWYMLNCVGRQTPYSEVAGPFAHWLVEKELGHSLNVPMVEEAVNGLVTAIKDIVYVPDEDAGVEKKTA